MGLFDFLFGSRKGAAHSDELREWLFAAIQAKDSQRLGALCEQHHDAILEALKGWSTVPEPMRQDSAAIEQYIHCLGTLASFLARLGDEADIWRRLSGPDDKNPIIQWPKKLSEAETLMAEVRFSDVIPLMSDLLNQVQDLEDVGGNVVATSLPKTYGHLGVSYFQTGQADKAVEPMTKALELCRQHGDVEGIIAYLGNLFETHRFLGQPQPAADYAERLADALAKQGADADAVWYRKQAAIVRAGEPLVRLIAAVNEFKFELDDLKTLPNDCYVNFVFYRNRITLKPALRSLSEAEALWNQGRAEESLSALLAAWKADPFDPQSSYQMGTTALYCRGYVEAIASYQRAEQLAPGWFHCRRYLWLARKLADGKFEHETFLTLQALDGSRNDRTPEAKVALAREALAKTPDVAWLYLCMGGYLKELNQPRQAEAAFRRGLEHADDVDVKGCLLMELAVVLESKSPERTRLLEEAVNLNGNLVAAATARMILQQDAKGTSSVGVDRVC